MKRHIDYSDVEQFCNDIQYQVGEHLFEPTLIVGIARGGLVPATILSYRYNVPIKSLNWSFRDFDKQDENELYKIILNYNNVLFVEDIVDSGKSVKTLVDSIEFWSKSCKKHKSSFRVAALIQNIDLDFNVDYFSLAISREQDKRWFVFPWEELV